MYLVFVCGEFDLEVETLALARKHRAELVRDGHAREDIKVMRFTERESLLHFYTLCDAGHPALRAAAMATIGERARNAS